MPLGNGNKFKGNKGKKGNRRKNANAEFDGKTDQYAKVVAMQGGRHMTVQPLDNPDETFHALIKGSHHRKVWYKKDELIVICKDGNIVEVKGKVPDTEINSVRTKFDKLDGNHGGIIFGNVGDLSDSDDDDNEDIASGKRSHKIIPSQPSRDFEPRDDNELNIDDI